MIYLNNKEKLDRIKLNKNNYYIISDFDQTITSGLSIGTWGIDVTDKDEFNKKRQDLYNKYRPIEIDNTIDIVEKYELMRIWYMESLKILVEYKIKEKDIDEAIKKDEFKLRTGAKEFLQKMYNYNIPVLMLSAGIGNVIEKFLAYNNINFNNIYLDSNYLIFKDGDIQGIADNIIHTMNKNYNSLIKKYGNLVKNKEYILLFGDILSDINMVSKDKLENTITIGFLDINEKENLEIYNKTFDIVCTRNTSFNKIMEFLNI